jgi:glycosyltransferase involved in cell wall biosynthesis
MFFNGLSSRKLDSLQISESFALVRIAINALLVSTERSFRNTGVSRYIRCLVRALADVDRESTFTIFTAREVASLAEAPNLHFIRTAVGARQPWRRIAWEQAVLPTLLRRFGIDLLHSPMNVAPIVATVKSVVTIHDLSFLRHPSMNASRRNLHMRAGTAWSARHSDAVVTFTRAMRSEVIGQYGIAAGKVTSIPLAPMSAAGSRPVAVTSPFFLAVGTLEPRKNLRAALSAFESVRERLPHHLVVVGPSGWKDELIRSSLADSERVTFLGYVDDVELSWLYENAEALVYVSHYEGFGLPPLEAMSLGCPVVVSQAASLREVCAGAGLEVNADDVGEIASALVRVAEDRAFRNERERRSRCRAALFDWRKTASRTVDVYRAVAEGRPVCGAESIDW